MKAALIADDLTGANNAGVIVAKQSLATMTVSHSRPSFPGECEVICVDTDSRYVSQEVAKARVYAAATWAASRGAQVFCKRVDNLLRGNIGAETDGVLAHLGPDAAAIVSPAFPALGRLIVHGALLVDGRPVHEHPVAAGDPFAPVRRSSIAGLLAEQSGLETAQIRGDDDGFDDQALQARIEDAVAGGARLIVVDQRSDAEVASLARAMARIEGPLAPVDPGPLSALYLSELRRRMRPGARGAGVLVAVGSVTPVTRGQFRHLLDDRKASPILIEPLDLIGSETKRGDAVAQAVAAAEASIRSGALTVLTTRLPDQEALDLNRLAATSEIGAHALSKRISDGLAAAVLAAVEASGGAIGGCFASGGDLVASIFESSGAEAIRVIGDVIPLTAHVALVGGAHHGLQMVTKGGSIGGEDALARCVAFLERAVAAQPAASDA